MLLSLCNDFVLQHRVMQSCLNNVHLSGLILQEHKDEVEECQRLHTALVQVCWCAVEYYAWAVHTGEDISFCCPHFAVCPVVGVAAHQCRVLSLFFSHPSFNAPLCFSWPSR